MSDAARAKATEIFEAADGEPGEERVERALDAFAAEQTAALRAGIKKALGHIHDYTRDDGPHDGMDLSDAICALRALLAEPEEKA